jgi:2-methylisocitrate lyase-like PEP mutase family enzyme
MPFNHHISTLRGMLTTRRGVLLPGAPNALAARVIADLGFEAVYLTGAGLTNMHLGLPDLGFMDLSQVIEHTMAIRAVVDLPLIVDADTGFGNAVNVAHTVKMLEQAGASAVQLEDQSTPKRCGHFDGKELISAEEVVNKVKAAVDARRNGLVVIARTDACAVESFEAAIDRAGRYIEAGADMTFVEAPATLAQLEQIPELLAAPQMLNMVLGGNAALQGAIQGMQAALRALREGGVLDKVGGLIASFAERQRLVDKSRYDALERRYATLQRG